MIKKGLIICIILLVVSSLVVVTVIAQDEVPPPYAGVQNTFPWNDQAAQVAGKNVYQQYCLGCHGIDGSSIPASDFSALDYPQKLEEKPDLYFWILSEGRMERGMPGFKSSLSQDQRWQVMTYMWYLGQAPTTPPPEPKPDAGFIQLNTGVEVEAGQPLVISAVLLDIAGEPIQGETVVFFSREDFFATGLMEVGEARTDVNGIATFSYVPRRSGETELVASYGDLQTSANTVVTGTVEKFYRVEVGIPLLKVGPTVFIGPETATESTVGQAPTTALRLPGGLFSFLWLLVLALVLIWGTYFRVLYQVFRIPALNAIDYKNVSLVPRIGLIIVVALGIIMVLMIITGPYSNFHIDAF